MCGDGGGNGRDRAWTSHGHREVLKGPFERRLRVHNVSRGRPPACVNVNGSEGRGVGGRGAVWILCDGSVGG